MEKKYSDALKTGLKCGLVITIIYMVISLIGVGLNHTPAMVSYKDKLSRYNQEMFNQSYRSGYGEPYTTSHPMPQPPLEYYIDIILSLVMFALVTIGLLATGAYALRKGGQPKYSLKDTIYMGGLAGLGPFVTILAGMVIVNAINYIVNGSYMTYLANSIPGEFSSLLVAVVAIEAVCCCLPLGFLAAVVLSCIGAAGYVILTGKLESRSARV